VELIPNTINMLLEGATDTPSSIETTDPNQLPLSAALKAPNIHHFLVAGQSAMPVDSAGNPWSGFYVYKGGNLVLDMLYGLILESTGRLQKCRLYEMSDNIAFRSTVSYLIVRDLTHEKAFAKALETLGVDWGKTMPIPKIETSYMPEVKELEKKNLHNQIWTFSNETSEVSKIFAGDLPFGDGELETINGNPDGFKMMPMPDAPQEFAPGLDKDLLTKGRLLPTNP
jgi:Mn-containing catalase